MNERILNAIRKLKEQQDETRVDLNTIKKQLDKSGNYYLQRLMRQMEEDISNYSIQDGEWYFNGRPTGVKAEGIDGKDGNIGPQGKPGKDGKDGKDGKPGRDGKDGKQGPQGLPGKDGKDGRDGKDGINGKDAVIPTFKIGKVETSPEYGGANAKIRLGKDGVLYLDLTLPRGPQGFAGFDAKINGRNTLELEAGRNITLEETEKGLKINATGGGSGGGAVDDVTVNGTSVVENGVAKVIAYQKPAAGIPKAHLANSVQTSLEKADTSYQKPSGGIPKTDLASAVQTSLEKADTALQEEQYTGTITGITMNGTSKGTSGVVDLGTVITDISSKQDTLVSGTNIKTINNESILGSGNISVSGGGGTDINALHYKGHVTNLSQLPTTGQTSATATTPNVDMAGDRTIAGQDTSTASTFIAAATTTYPYVLGAHVGKNSWYNMFIRATDETAIDAITYGYVPSNSKACVGFHITYNPNKAVQVKTDSSSISRKINYDDGTTLDVTTSWTTITKSGWFFVGNLDTSGTTGQQIKVYSNISKLGFIECPFKTIVFNNSEIWTNVQAVKSITNSSIPFTWANDYQILSFDSSTYLASYVTTTTPSADAIENNVYTVGDTYEIYRCNSIPVWEHWSQKREEVVANANYSETEHLVGTWIDGKPLYEKTFKLTTIPQVTTDGTAVSAITDVSGMNIDSGFIYGAFLQSNARNQNGNFQTLPYINNSGYQMKMQLGYNNLGVVHNLIIVSTGSAYNGTAAVFCTLRYTKTTDSAS